MSNINPAMDSINQRTMRDAVHEYHAIALEGLNAQESALLGAGGDLTGLRLLDLGVGAGRTVRPLRAISREYVGVDYMQEMVDHCRREFPDVRFEQADARSMKQFADGSFDVVFFSCNGISMVDHAGRLAILGEVRRLLAPDGLFAFSTCNRNSPQFEARFRFPDFQFTRHPLKLLVRSARFLAQTAFRARNRLRYLPHEVRAAEFAILNDVCHHYQTMLYFIDVKQQVRQLEKAGFTGVGVYDLSGRPAIEGCRDGTIGFVARKGPLPV